MQMYGFSHFVGAVTTGLGFEHVACNPGLPRRVGSRAKSPRRASVGDLKPTVPVRKDGWKVEVSYVQGFDISPLFCSRSHFELRSRVSVANYLVP